MICESPVLRIHVKSAYTRLASNLEMSREFSGDTLLLTGAHRATRLRSIPARHIFRDERDACLASDDEDSDPFTLALARTITFPHRRKML